MINGRNDQWKTINGQRKHCKTKSIAKRKKALQNESFSNKCIFITVHFYSEKLMTEKEKNKIFQTIIC